MSDKSTLALTLAEGDLERIITTTIQAQVAAAFAGSDVAGKVIETMLNEKVDANGNKSSYSHANKHSMIEVMCRNQLRRMVKESILGWIKEHEPELRKAVAAQLKTKKTQNAIASALLGSLVEATENQYRFNIDVTAAAQLSED